MIAYYHAVRGVSRKIAGAVDGAVDALIDGRVEQEPAMTDRMLGAIESSLKNYSRKGIRWSAKTLTDRGQGAQESKYGADFMGVLNIDLPDFKVSKGFLAQAKLVRRGQISDVKKMKEQCEKMLDLSPDSFVFLYGVDGVQVVPAISVLGAGVSALELYRRSAQRFFEEHLQCFIGDRKIQAPTLQALKCLRDEFSARSGLILEAKSHSIFME